MMISLGNLGTAATVCFSQEGAQNAIKEAKAMDAACRARYPAYPASMNCPKLPVLKAVEKAYPLGCWQVEGQSSFSPVWIIAALAVGGLFLLLGGGK